MHRVSRDRLFHRFIGDIKFERRLSHGLTDPQIYEIADRFCALVCSKSAMVVEASVKGFAHSHVGTFGDDEPWPEWADRSDLTREGILPPEE
jgi:hypothetical protein